MDIDYNYNRNQYEIRFQEETKETIIKALSNALSEFEWSKDYESAELIGKIVSDLEKVTQLRKELN